MIHPAKRNTSPPPHSVKAPSCSFIFEQPPLPFTDLELPTVVIEVKIRHCPGLTKPDCCEKCNLTVRKERCSYE